MMDMAIYMGLDCITRLQRNGKVIQCVVHSITEDCAEAVVTASELNFRGEEDVELRILLPVERSPITCTGRISENGSQAEGDGEHSAEVLITNMSRLDRRRLELFISRKKAFIGGDGRMTPPHRIAYRSNHRSDAGVSSVIR